ncbi:MAG: redox-sensing transcriptional repressor Rex [Bacillota bacterium]|jgi:redox-sensing transcriptional repressor|nr:redox-sensing transcriptional repressor Rex [Candidatus Fermentithermobacillaceae bacterium]
MRNKIPDVVIRRLVTYLRILTDIEAGPDDYISSAQIGDLAAVNSAQVRKDLALFGEFGKQGVGYPILGLRKELTAILGADREMNIVIFGVGELGTALARYLTTRKETAPNYRFVVKGLFDIDPAKVGTEIEGVPVRHLNELEEVTASGDIKIGVVAVPANVAQEVVNYAISKGIRGFLNFAPVRIKVPPGVRIQNSDVTSDLQELGFYL